MPMLATHPLLDYLQTCPDGRDDHHFPDCAVAYRFLTQMREQCGDLPITVTQHTTRVTMRVDGAGMDREGW